MCRVRVIGCPMPDNLKIEFADIKQDRSRKTLDDILEAANNLIEQADPDLFTSRLLAAHSGYSLGTLNKRLLSVENVFVWLIEQGQKHHVKNAIQIVAEFNPNSPLKTLVEELFDFFATVVRKVNPKVIRYFEHRIALKFGFVEDYERVDALIKPLQEAAMRDKTDTFRHLSEAELKMILRASLSFFERPFVYGEPIAGTPEHRRIAVDNAARMLGR